MAITGAQLSAYSTVLKEIYLPTVQEQLNNTNVLSAFIETNEQDISGKTAYINMHTGRTTALGARADGGALPTAKYQTHKTAEVGMKYNYGVVEFTGPTIAATRDERGAYARVIDNEVNRLVDDMAREVNRQLWGCGYGILARWRSTGSGTSYTLQQAYTGNTAGGNAFGSTFGDKYLKEMPTAVPVVTAASTSVIVTATVDATDIAPTAFVEAADRTYVTITCTDPGVTEAAGTFYIRPASGVSITASTDEGAFRLEMMGLRGIVTNTNLDDIALVDGASTSLNAGLNDPLQGLDPAVAGETFWASHVLTHSGGRYTAQRPIDTDLMQQMFDKVEISAGKDYGPDTIITTHAIRRELIKLFVAERRTINTMELKGGFTGIDYNGVPILVDRDAIDGEIYFLTLKDLQMYRMSDYDWMDRDGAILARVSGYDAYQAVLFRYAELGCNRRNSQGVICDISYSLT